MRKNEIQLSKEFKVQTTKAIFAFLLSRKYFLMKKTLLKYQEELLKNHT